MVNDNGKSRKWGLVGALLAIIVTLLVSDELLGREVWVPDWVIILLAVIGIAALGLHIHENYL
jgi:hypothetical protein